MLHLTLPSKGPTFHMALGPVIMIADRFKSLSLFRVIIYIL